MSTNPLVVIAKGRHTVLYRKNGRRYRGQRFNAKKGTWSKTSSINADDITHWYHSYPPRLPELAQAFNGQAELAMGSLPTPEERDEDCNLLAETRPSARKKLAATL
jgi:hypothetical protein